MLGMSGAPLFRQRRKLCRLHLLTYIIGYESPDKRRRKDEITPLHEPSLVPCEHFGILCPVRHIPAQRIELEQDSRGVGISDRAKHRGSGIIAVANGNHRIGVRDKAAQLADETADKQRVKRALLHPTASHRAAHCMHKIAHRHTSVPQSVNIVHVMQNSASVLRHIRIAKAAFDRKAGDADPSPAKGVYQISDQHSGG